MATPDHVIARCLQYFMNGETINSISKRSDTPSRPTIDKYAKEGTLTNGIPWDRYKEEKEEMAVAKVKAEIATARAEKGAGFMQEMKEFIETDLFTQMMAAVKAGDVEVRVKDFTDVAKLYAMLNNTAGEKMEFATWFMREVFSIAFEIMDERQYALFKNKVVGFQAEVQEKMNPIPVAMLPPSTS